MESFFDVKLAKTLASENSGSNGDYFCSISTCNIVAFTSTTNLLVASTDSISNNFGFYVFICDINSPWKLTKVTERSFPISVIEWDQSGTLLLIADIKGDVSIYAHKNNFLNEWERVTKISYPGEKIIKVAFFHNGSKIQYNYEKKDSVLYSEKFTRINFSPSVRKFGGVGEFGCLIVTATGMLGCFLIPQLVEHYNMNSAQGSQMQDLFETNANESCSIGKTRNLFTSADICYADGQFMVALTNCNSNKSIIVKCFRVKIEHRLEKTILSSQALSSFFLHEGVGKDLSNLQIVSLKWLSYDGAESMLIVSANFASGSYIEIWRLAEESIPIHKLFQTNKNENFKTFVWTSQQSYKHNSSILKIVSNKLNFGTNSFIFVAYQDNVIHCLNRDGLKRMATTVNFQHLATVSISGSSTRITNNDLTEHASKHIRLSARIAAIDVSWLGHFVLALDNQGTIYCFKNNFVLNEHASTPVGIVNLLEYCMISGLDSLEVLLNIKSQMLDAIVDKFNDNFNRQPLNVTQYYYVKFLTMKINLHRLSISGQSKVHDLTSLLMLHSILTAFKSLLRPSDLSTSQDKGPAENLAMILSESVVLDVDKVLLNLEAKDFTVEPSTLQSLQQLIQWVADLALNILAKLPENRSFLNSNKAGDISEIMALNSIRELLVMIRIWGLLNKQCLPFFSRSADSLDTIATIFKLLTKLALNPNDPDDIFLDECCLLPSQVLIPQLQYTTPRTSISSPVLPHLNLPLHFEYGTEYEQLKFTNHEIPYIEGCLTSNHIVDSIRYIQLGKSSVNLRKCTRCGNFTTVNSIARTPAMIAWVKRWKQKCRCGGFWELEKV